MAAIANSEIVRMVEGLNELRDAAAAAEQLGFSQDSSPSTSPLNQAESSAAAPPLIKIRPAIDSDIHDEWEHFDQLEADYVGKRRKRCVEGSVDELRRLVDERRSADGVLHFTAVKYHARFAVNWYYHLNAIDQRNALVFVADEELCSLLLDQGLPVFSSSLLIHQYSLCRDIDPGSGTKVLGLIELLQQESLSTVIYSDADVVWRRAPSASLLSQVKHVAFQTYNDIEEPSSVPGSDTTALLYDVQEGSAVNFGLFIAKRSEETLLLMQELFRRMSTQFSFVTAPHWRRDNGIDRVRVYACNDQNTLQSLITERSASSRRSSLQHLSARHFPVARVLLFRSREQREALLKSDVVALHMTTYFGSDKSFPLKDFGLWMRGGVEEEEEEEQVERINQVLEEKSGSSDQWVDVDELDGKKKLKGRKYLTLLPARFRSGEGGNDAVVASLQRLFMLALSLNRTVILPEYPCPSHISTAPYQYTRRFCSVDFFLDLAGLSRVEKLPPFLTDSSLFTLAQAGFTIAPRNLVSFTDCSDSEAIRKAMSDSPLILLRDAKCHLGQSDVRIFNEQLIKNMFF